jgi:hypothetical protein
MRGISATSLAAAGCDDGLANLLEAHAAVGDEASCLRLLRAHRCELVEAMHEAQRPIDVCDWIIREVETHHDDHA